MKLFEEIYEDYARDVYRFLLGMTHEPELAEELTQETFFKALKASTSFRGEAKMTTWLFQIAKNCYNDYLRAEKRRSKLLEEYQYQLEEEGPLEKDQEKLHRILQILETMTEPYRSVFRLRVLEGKTHGELAEHFGKSEAWARVTYFRAKEQIRLYYKEEIQE